MNSPTFLQISVNAVKSNKAFSVFVPMSSIAYLEQVTKGKYFIYLKDGIQIRNISNGDLIDIKSEQRKTLGLPD